MNRISLSKSVVRPFFWLISFAMLTGLAGCGNEHRTHPVKGTVRFEDGTAPMFGDIEFFNESAKINARGKIQKDGTFTVGTYQDGDGAVEGTHQIVIIQNTGTVLEDQMQVDIHHDHGSLVDRSYFDYRTSNLRCTIKRGENEVELVVKKHPE